METDIQSRYIAAIVAEERIQVHHREKIKLNRTLKVADIFHSIAKLFS